MVRVALRNKTGATPGLLQVKGYPLKLDAFLP